MAHMHTHITREEVLPLTFLLTIMNLRLNLDLDWNLIGNHSQMMIRQITLHWCNLFILAFLTQPIIKKHIYPSADITIICWALI